MTAFNPKRYLATCLDESCELCHYPETATLIQSRRGPVATYCRNCGASSGDIDAAWTAPRYPHPMTERRIAA